MLRFDAASSEDARLRPRSREPGHLGAPTSGPGIALQLAPAAASIWFHAGVAGAARHGLSLIEAVETLAEKAHDERGCTAQADRRVIQGQSFVAGTAAFPQEFPSCTSPACAPAKTGDIVPDAQRYVAGVSAAGRHHPQADRFGIDPARQW